MSLETTLPKMYELYDQLEGARKGLHRMLADDKNTAEAVQVSAAVMVQGLRTEGSTLTSEPNVFFAFGRWKCSVMCEADDLEGDHPVSIPRYFVLEAYQGDDGPFMEWEEE